MPLDDGVTIAIPNWNHELLLPRAIRSGLEGLAVLRRHGLAGEVLVIDDCSRDGSVGVLRQLEARYYADGLRVLAFGKNGGLSMSRNAALAHARYKSIAFVDADNEVIPENLPAFAATLRDTGAAGAYGTMLLRSATCTLAHAAFSHESFQDRMFDVNYVDACALFDVQQIQAIGGYSVQRWEDHELWLHLAACGREAVFVPLVFGYYYVLPTSMSVDPAENANIADMPGKLKRVYNQVDARTHMPLRTRHRRYHPALGYF